MREVMVGYFKAELLDSIRTVTLRGVRIPPPPFYLQAQATSGQCSGFCTSGLGNIKSM